MEKIIELKEYIYENRDYFAGVDVETYQALRAFLHSENMLKDFTVSGKEARIDMCQALEELYQDGVKEGREEGASMIILNMLKSGMSVSDIKKYANHSDSNSLKRLILKYVPEYKPQFND